MITLVNLYQAVKLLEMIVLLVGAVLLIQFYQLNVKISLEVVFHKAI